MSFQHEHEVDGFRVFGTDSSWHRVQKQNASTQLKGSSDKKRRQWQQRTILFV